MQIAEALSKETAQHGVWMVNLLIKASNIAPMHGRDFDPTPRHQGAHMRSTEWGGSFMHILLCYFAYPFI